MKLGFIGTGKITSSVVSGICRSNLSFKKILLSSRNRSIAKKLTKNFKKVSIAKNNQEILNSCNWIFLAVTPTVGQKIIKDLKFKSTHTIISFISTIKYNKLKSYIKTNCIIVRAIPLPPISLGVGPIPIYPPNTKVKKFFDKIGKTVEIKNENLSLNFWAMSSMMAPYYEMQNFLSNWLVKNGLNKVKAENYITSLFLGLSKNANENTYKDLKELVSKSQTPRGLNEHALRELKKANFYKKLNITSYKILKRLKGK